MILTFIKIDIRETVVFEGVDWVCLPQDRDQRQAVVNTTVTPRVTEMRGSLLPAERTVSF
jgi:hypothetical protein